MALSHTWGKVKLTTLTASLFKYKINYTNLPQTFKDAIVIARKFRQAFDVRYIWIDILCIIQDSMADWAQEATKMGQIYKNAFCVLAATSGVDGNSGLFFDCNPLSLCPVSLNLKMENHAQKKFICENGRGFETDIQESPLLRRARVVQERTMAKRVLHFTAHQLYWECVTMEASEAHLNDLIRKPYPLNKNWSSYDFKIKRSRGKLMIQANHMKTYTVFGLILSIITHVVD